MESQPSKEIVIIAFRFPPMGGVGSRRWAKFSKYLAQRGYRVHVITIPYPYADKVNWSHDVKDENILVHRVRNSYPAWMLKNELNFAQNLLSFAFRKIRGRSHYYLDPAQQWGKYLIPYANDIIRDRNITDVVVTGPPSSLHYTGSFLKVENPKINLIQDFRDPWNSEFNYSYSPQWIREFWQKEKSAYMEMFSILNSDKIVVTSSDMKFKISSYGSFPEKFHVIYNGFDRDDFDSDQTGAEMPSFSLIYAGRFNLNHEQRVKALHKLVEAIAGLNDQYINANLKIILHSNLTLEFFNQSPHINVFRQNFVFQDMVSPSLLPGILKKNYCCLSINAEGQEHAIGAKVFDYMGLGLPIFHIANGGELYDLLKKKKQYTSTYDVSDLKETLLRLKSDYVSGNRPDCAFPEFDIECLTTQYEKLFQCNG